MKHVVVAAVLAAAVFAGNASAAGWQGSFNASFQAAAPGETITVPAGTYPSETVSGTKTAPVTFVMAGPVAVNGTLRVEAHNVTFEGGTQMKVTYLLVFGGTNVVASGIDGTHFDIFDTNGPVVISGGDWGPCQAPRDDPSCLSRIGSGSNVTIEGNSFHNITSTDLANFHVDGMAVFGGANNVVRRNRYFGNMITNIRVQNCCGNPAISNLTIEGNSFQAAVNGQGGKNANGIDIDSTVPGLKIRFNSFEQGTYIQNTAPSNSGAQYTGNLYSHVSCLPGVTYAYNVFVPWSDTQGQSGCSATDTKVASLGYALFPGLVAGAPGIDRGGVSCSGLDLDGNARPQGAACDAGAVEAGSSPPPPPLSCTGSGGTAPLDVRVLSQTTSTITLGWTPVLGAIGYRFVTSAAGSKYSTTNDPFRSTVRFSKIAAGGCYYVLTQMPGAGGGVKATSVSGT